jgi:DNA-binding NtrC family response regulator
MLSYPWPGNVRELKNTLEVAVAFVDSDEIEVRHLELPDETREGAVAGYHQQIESFRRDLIRRALKDAKGNQAEAARRLGLTRQALSYLVRKLRIEDDT